MKINQVIYVCGQCKKITTSLKELYFVEEIPGRGFCSEECIQSFYTKIVNHFEGIERGLRNEMQLQNEDALNYITDRKRLEKVLASPDEIWRLSNEIGEVIHSYILHIEAKENYSIIVLCYVYDYAPSFVISVTATSSQDLLNEFSIGKRITDISAYLKDNKNTRETTFDLNQETILLLENKKSQILAKILENRNDADIPFESFENYLTCKEDTLKTPDEIYQTTDSDGDLTNIYIKSFELNNEVFYYFVMCINYQNENNEPLILPFFFFPSKSVEVYQIFKTGNCLEGAVKN